MHDTSVDICQKKLKAGTSDSYATCLEKAVEYKERLKKATLKQDNLYF